MSEAIPTVPILTPRRPRRIAGTALAFWALLLGIGFVVAYPILIAASQVMRDVWVTPPALFGGTLARVLLNTFVVVVSGSVLALAAGAALACLHERTDGSLGAAGELLPLAPLMVPPIAGVIGWAVLLDPNAGLLNNLLRAGLGLAGVRLESGPFNIYSIGGLIGMTALSLVPYVYLVVAAALRRLDPAIEEAARVCGTPPLRTLVRVTLPAIMPALAGAFLVALVAGIGLFSVPIVLGTAARVDVISVYIYRLLDSYPPNTASALALAAMLMAVVQVLLWAQRLVAPPGRHAQIGGRGMRSAPLSLGRWRNPARSLGALYLAATSVLPVAGLLLVSLQPFWTPAVDWPSLSLVNYHDVILDNATTRQALLTSMALGVVVATIAMAAAAFLTLRGAPRARRWADSVMTLPATIPHTFIGVSFLLAFSLPPFRMYGSMTILLLAYLAMGLPFAARAAGAAASGIGRELGEASRVAGASEARTLRRVLLPLALPGLAAGWVIVFIHTAGELTASAFLSSAGNPVIGRVLMDFWIFGNFPQVAALALIMTVVNTLCVSAMLALSRRSLRATIG